MKKTLPFTRLFAATRMFAIGTLACLTLAACSPDNDPQPTTNNSPSINPESQTPNTPNTQTPGHTPSGVEDKMEHYKENNMNASLGYGSSSSSSSMDDSMSSSSATIPGENLDTDRGVGTVPPTTYSD